MKTKVAIIVAGPAGMAAAFELSKHENFQVTLFEASNQVGGMARSITLWDQRVDLGPHRFFTKVPMVQKLWREGAGETSRVRRKTRIYFRKKFYPYPLAIGPVLRNIGPINAIRAGLSYLKARMMPFKDRGDFESWVQNAFGDFLYSLFFKRYSEKLWGIECHHLDAAFARQRIKKFNFLEALLSSLGWKSGKHRTLTEEIDHPVLGAGVVYEKLAEQIVARGGVIRFNARVARLAPREGGWELMDQSGQSEVFTHVISSMPLTSFVNAFESVPSQVQAALKELKFRNTILVYLQLSGGPFFEDQWVYLQDPNLKSGRVTNFSNWGMTRPENQTILCLEFWANDEESLWQASDEELQRLASEELCSSGLLGAGVVQAAHVLRIAKSYPIYFLGYTRHVDVVREFLQTKAGIQVIGCYGSYKYNNQDHSLLMGLLAAQNIIHQRSVDLWNVNADDDYHETQKS